MPRTIFMSIVALLVITAVPGTPSSKADAIGDPETVAAVLEHAEPPDDLPGNTGGAIGLATWETIYGEPLEGATGAWLLTGAAELPIATVIVFPSADAAQTGIGEFTKAPATATPGGLTIWTVANRGNWICLAVDGPVMMIGQASRQPEASDEEIRNRACDALAATHEWLLGQLAGSAAATPAP